MRFFLLFFAFASTVALAAGKDADDSAAKPPAQAEIVIGALDLAGLHRTRQEYVRAELGFSVGQKVSVAAILRAAQRLRNTNFFVSVEVDFEETLDGNYNLTFNFIEKWTLTPVLRGGTGGGVNFLVVGLYDLNLFGRGIEAGLQYEQFAGAPGVNLWWRQPYVARPVWRVMADAQLGRRPYFYFEPLTRSYATPLARNDKLTVGVQRRISLVDVGVGLESVDRELLGDLSVPLKSYKNFSRRREAGIVTRMSLRLNAMNLNDYVWDGHRIELSAANFFPTNDSEHGNIQTVSLADTHFWSWSEENNFGIRLQAHWTNGDSLLSLIRMGSLDSVRGLDDGERLGQLAWAANMEERWVALVNENIVLQTVLFADAGNAGKSLKEWPYPLAASAGAGLRMGFRPIARLRLRADYARAVTGLRRSGSWVVGMQHYF
ncbi:MAG: hypothetical protein RL189_2579 [Pseudomonadota bacterium]